MPSSIERLYRTYRDRGLAVVAIDIEEPKAKVEAWARGHALTFPILLDTDGTVNTAYRVTATPTTFVLGGDGKLIGIAHGTKDWMGEHGRALMEALLR